MKPRFHYALVFLAALSACFAAGPARASVTITPTSILIEGRQRFADVTVINTSDTSSSYEMVWQYTRVKEGTGTYDKVERPDTDFALGEHIVFTPRRIILAPRSSQRVRMALRLNGAPPAPGDYRAHFFLTQAAQMDADRTQPQGGRNNEMGAVIRIGVSIPVVYRVGESDARATIGEVRTQVNKDTGKIELLVPVDKTKSDYGVMGSLEVLYNGSGKDESIGGINNANIFRDITHRDFVIPLSVGTLAGGELTVVYHALNDREVVLDQKRIPIGK